MRVCIAIILILTQSISLAENDSGKEHSEHHEIEEVLVSGVLGKSVKDTALPINVLSNEELRENAASTIGETLQSQIGVNTASFGPGVGQPVIRGQSANRVQVLSNGTGALDVSNTSQDHANAVEGLLAQRIEVIRGPATLLYGNGAIGGVVNVIDNRIPSSVPGSVNGALEYRYNDVNDGSTGVVLIDGGHRNIAWHLDGVWQNTSNVDIPAAANLLEPDEGSIGFIENSGSEKTNVTGGVSFVGETGYFGISINRLDNNYGLPPGAHGHEEGGDETEEFIRLDMQQTRIDLKADYDLEGWVENIRLNLTTNDYTHTELEGREVGTVFDNKGVELRVNAKHVSFANGITGSMGLQFIDRDFSALGEEAFIPASKIRSIGAYLVEGIDVGDFTYEAGLRIDNQDIDTDLDCNATEISVSSSMGAIWNISDSANLLFSINRSERAASIEERYSNVAVTGCDATIVQPDPDSFVTHAATGRIELGNADLEKETASNLEIAYRKHSGITKAEISVFINSIQDYIYLADVGASQNSIISQYLQEDARFVGLETSYERPLKKWSDDNFVNLNLFADYVEAELDSGHYLPRIPPLRAGFEIEYAQQDWRVKLRNTFVQSQDKNSLNESSTENYQRLDLFADYHLHFDDKELLLFAKGKNLLDEDIRNHSSFLKSFAPDAGRSIELGVRYTY